MTISVGGRVGLFLFLIFVFFTHLAAAIQATPDSPCASECIDSSNLDKSDSNSSTTTSSDFSCRDTDFTSTAKGQKWQKCLSCLQNSTYSQGSESDQAWFFYNIRYNLDYCIFGYPNATDVGSNSCQNSTSCSVLEDSLIQGIPSVSSSGNSSTYAYCSTDGGVFANSSADVQGCMSCVSSIGNTTYLANTLVALEAGCQQQLPSNISVGLSGSIFSSTLISITNPNASIEEQDKKSSHIAKTTIVVIIVAAVLFLFAVFGFGFVCWRKRKTRHLRRLAAERYAANNNMILKRKASSASGGLVGGGGGSHDDSGGSGRASKVVMIVPGSQLAQGHRDSDGASKRGRHDWSRFASTENISAPAAISGKASWRGSMDSESALPPDVEQHAGEHMELEDRSGEAQTAVAASQEDSEAAQRAKAHKGHLHHTSSISRLESIVESPGIPPAAQYGAGSGYPVDMAAVNNALDDKLTGGPQLGIAARGPPKLHKLTTTAIVSASFTNRRYQQSPLSAVSTASNAYVRGSPEMYSTPTSATGLLSQAPWSSSLRATPPPPVPPPVPTTIINLQSSAPLSAVTGAAGNTHNTLSTSATPPAPPPPPAPSGSIHERRTSTASPPVSMANWSARQSTASLTAAPVPVLGHRNSARSLGGRSTRSVHSLSRPPSSNGLGAATMTSRQPVSSDDDEDDIPPPPPLSQQVPRGRTPPQSHRTPPPGTRGTPPLPSGPLPQGLVETQRSRSSSRAGRAAASGDTTGLGIVGTRQTARIHTIGHRASRSDAGSPASSRAIRVDFPPPPLPVPRR